MSHTKSADHETEEALIQRAQTAVSQCNWTVGDCAAKWTKRFARGRTDADFGVLVGMSGDQIYQRRRVCETFSDLKEQCSALNWSHFYIALNWDDASECLSWANENAATIAEMKAWRRLQHGEDVTATVSEDDERPAWGSDGASVIFPFGVATDGSVRSASDLELPAVRAPLPTGVEARGGKRGVAEQAAAGLSQGEYTPYRSGAATPPREVLDDVPGSHTSVSVEQSVKRLAITLERCAKAITPEVRQQFAKLPEKVRVRFLAAMKELHEQAAKLK